MIKSVTITNHLEESIIIELRNPEKSGFLIYSIDGLGPAKAEINKTELATLDGSFFNSSRVTSRNIVISMVFWPMPTIEATRLLLYKYFPIKKRIKLQIETDNRTGLVYGYVESNEPNIFSKQEGTVVSIVCPEAYFYEDADLVESFSSIESVFEFPFSNESTTVKLLNFGDISLSTTKSIYYAGDASIGVLVGIHFTGTVTGIIQIEKLNTEEMIEIDTAIVTDIVGSAAPVAGDDIILSTVTGEKYLILTRGANEYNIINSIGKYPDWFKLVRGDNLFSYGTTGSGETAMQFTITSKIAYEGI